MAGKPNLVARVWEAPAAVFRYSKRSNSWRDVVACAYCLAAWQHTPPLTSTRHIVHEAPFPNTFLFLYQRAEAFLRHAQEASVA